MCVPCGRVDGCDAVTGAMATIVKQRVPVLGERVARSTISKYRLITRSSFTIIDYTGKFSNVIGRGISQLILRRARR